jgi:hemerythrin
MRVDVKLLDNDHKKLVLLINDLHEGIMTGRAKPKLEGVFEELVGYSRIHFAHEEQLLDETGFLGAEEHRQEHDEKIAQLVEMQTRFSNSTELVGDLEVINLLKDWILGHTQCSDQGFVAHLKAQGVDPTLAAWGRPFGVSEEKPAIQPRVLYGTWPA